MQKTCRTRRPDADVTRRQVNSHPLRASVYSSKKNIRRGCTGQRTSSLYITLPISSRRNSESGIIGSCRRRIQDQRINCSDKTIHVQSIRRIRRPDADVANSHKTLGVVEDRRGHSLLSSQNLIQALEFIKVGPQTPGWVNRNHSTHAPYVSQ